MTPSIAILIPYFGPWPAWINFFIESCRANGSIDWIVFNDADPPENRAPNVRQERVSFAEYKVLVSDALDIRLTAAEPYKLCDVRPALPLVHADLVRRYDFVGYGDLDVVYGDIRAFYDDDTLSRYDLLSSHAGRVSGHFCLMRNSPEMVGAFREIRGWEKAFERDDYVNFDERAFYNLFRAKRAKLFGSPRPEARCLFREAYSTPGADSGMRWYWQGGRLTNEFYPLHPFMYLHFMSWHSNRWYADQPGVGPVDEAPWALVDDIVQMDWRKARREGFIISRAGFQPIQR
ncbi:MAG: hypothetical protein M3438_09915 [Pseudomonadota bacterium]|nr:hypothetical protein [Sphingomonas sp.]MDQ3479452.1 hypothetical protein [Pseudomonadota bacterium]